ncbi:MAG: hypothetical protein R3C19_26525 [Planctomycetaceae bacterium]
MRTAVATWMLLSFTSGALNAQDALPFSHRVETFQDEDDAQIRAFVVRLEQPFFASEFEKNSYVRLKSLDDRSFLIYPRETRFDRNHAEFYGRLRGVGAASVRLSYETVSENPDGSRRVETRQADIEIPIPVEHGGLKLTYTTWAEYQNQHFANLLEYYPGESFFEYLLLQSRERYGVTPPPMSMSKLTADQETSEERLYHLFSGGLELQRTLQRRTLRGSAKQGDLTIHVSDVRPPDVMSPDYRELLKQKSEQAAPGPLPESASLIPQDQYYLRFSSWKTADSLHREIGNWIEPLLRMLTEDARDHHLRSKYETQLVTDFDDLRPLFQDGGVTELVLTGSDFYLAEGTDLTVLLRARNAEVLAKKQAEWLANAKQRFPDMEDREFNYLGTRIVARYTASREISSFQAQHEDWTIISNSHVAIRRVIDTVQNKQPSLASAPDFQYVHALHPSANDADSGYLFLSDAFLRYLSSPSFKIGERRRKQSLNNLVMLNNASLFYRLEYDRTPDGLASLIDGRFINRDKLVCPQGGAYAFDADSDAATNSVFNRLKYLTPIRELRVLQVSKEEKEEYERYVQRYSSFWKDYFSPLAVRLSTDPNLVVEYCLLPFVNSNGWHGYRDMLSEDERSLRLMPPAESMFTSITLLNNREQTKALLTSLPGVDGVLRDDPTLTDLSWLGNRVSFNFCDAHSVLEIDPTRLRQLNAPFPLQPSLQAAIATAAFAAVAPTYVTINVEDPDKADRFLSMLLSRVFLHESDVAGFETAIDAYQLPAHREHSIYGVTYRIYAARIRFYLSVVGGELVAATEPHVLRQVIDAALDQPPEQEISGQFAWRLRTSALQKLKDDVRTYWQEHMRRASYHNIMPIYTLLHLYDVPIGQVDSLSDAKYGVTFFSPDGEYRYDSERDEVFSTAYGNRQHAKQVLAEPGKSTFDRAFNRLKEVLLTVVFSDDAISGRIEVRSE